MYKETVPVQRKIEFFELTKTSSFLKRNDTFYCNFTYQSLNFFHIETHWEEIDCKTNVHITETNNEKHDRECGKVER